jgi:thiol-disulfide isomerase/thioredoxin
MKLQNIFLFALLSVGLLSSCSETNVIERPIIIDDTPDAEPVSGQFTKNVLIEDYTGTWCGNCTRVSHGIKQVYEQTSRAVAVAIHYGNDPYHFENIDPLKNLISPDFDLELPISRLNRLTVWTFPEPQNVQQVLNLTSVNCGLGIKMNAVKNATDIELTVDVKFVQNYEDLRLVVYLLEDDLFYRQRNYTQFYNAVNPIPNFEHDHVLRQSVTDLLGDDMGDNTRFGETFSRTFSIPIPTEVENPDKINFVAFVVDKDNHALNVRHCNLGENQTFQENP